MDDILQQLISKLPITLAWSIATDENTHICDTSKLIIFIYFDEDNKSASEDFPKLCILKDITKAKDILNAVVSLLEPYLLNWEMLISGSTGGAPSTLLILFKKGFVELLKKKIDRNQSLPNHCIINE